LEKGGGEGRCIHELGGQMWLVGFIEMKITRFY
jgi:hypothetical protein